MYAIEELSKPTSTDIRELAELLIDSVANGASVNFVEVPTLTFAEDWWRVATTDPLNQLFVARNELGRIVGCVRLMPAPQLNGPHRAEVGKLLVHSEFRKRGVAGDLMSTLEIAARNVGRTLLILDTETGSAAESFYRNRGWFEFGRLEGHTVDTAGKLSGTTFFAKNL